MTKKDYRLYILMRNDIPSMNPGRAMAQASHASNAFIHEWGHRKDVKDWQSQTKQGFGTAIVLSADLKQIREIFIIMDQYLTKGWVTDPDYVIRVSAELIGFIDKKHLEKFESTDEKSYLFHRQEDTCAYIFGTKEELSPFLGDLTLHP